MTITVLGAGSWGTALAILLGRKGLQVQLVGRNQEEIEILRNRRENLQYLPHFTIPSDVTPIWSGEPRSQADLEVVAVPSAAVREVMSQLPPSGGPIVLAAKGLEPGSGKLMSEVAEEVQPEREIGVLSGPNLALEIAKQIPTAAVCAFRSAETAEKVANLFSSSAFRTYRSDDLIGLELAGSLKNVLAIGAGLSDGLEFGENTKGALLARGLREMIALGISLGARLDTFIGVGGVGDLIATSCSDKSRNYRFGHLIARGKAPAEALEEIGQVVEGLGTSEGTLMLGKKQQIDLPIFTAIDAVIRQRVRPAEAVRMLMDRIPQPDHLGVNASLSD